MRIRKAGFLAVASMVSLIGSSLYGAEVDCTCGYCVDTISEEVQISEEEAKLELLVDYLTDVVDGLDRTEQIMADYICVSHVGGDKNDLDVPYLVMDIGENGLPEKLPAFKGLVIAELEKYEVELKKISLVISAIDYVKNETSQKGYSVMDVFSDKYMIEISSREGEGMSIIVYDKRPYLGAEMSTKFESSMTEK